MSPRTRLTLAGLAFVSLGLPDAALGVAWPGIRDGFGLAQSGLGLVLAAIGVGFVVSSNVAAALLARLGVGRLLALSTATVAAALTLQAAAPAFVLVLTAAAILGLGSGAIDSGLNAYAATRFSPRHMNWLHAAYGLGTAIAPFVMTAVLGRGGGWRHGYLVLAAALGALAVVFWRSRGRWAATRDRVDSGPRLRGLGLSPRGWGHVLAFFLYTGVEVTAGQWAFAVLSEARGLGAAAAGTWTGLYWTSLFAGRVLVGFVADRVGARRLVAWSALGVVAGPALCATPVAALGGVGLGGAGLVVVGLAAAPIFPMMMTRTAERFEGIEARRLFGLQVSAAMLGGVAWPGLAGAVADATALAPVPWVLATIARALAAVLASLLRDGARRLR